MRILPGALLQRPSVGAAPLVISKGSIHFHPTMNIPTATLIPGFLQRQDADQLYQGLLTDIDWDDRMQTRKTACFGQPYVGSGIPYAACPMHPLLLPVLSRLSARLGYASTNCLLNYYPDGQSTMGYHADATHNLMPGTGIVILSLGAERMLTFRSKADPSLQVGYSLPHGSLFYMTQGTQDLWVHAIRRSETPGGRISLTFRRILMPEPLRALERPVLPALVRAPVVVPHFHGV